MRSKPSLEDEEMISIVQQMPDVAYLRLLEYLPEQDKCALLVCCRLLHDRTDGRFVQPKHPLPLFDYKPADKGAVQRTHFFTLERRGQKYKKFCFERLDQRQIVCAYPNGSISIFLDNTEVHTLECAHSITRLVVLSPQLMLCQNESRAVSVFSFDDNQWQCQLTIQCEASRIIDAVLRASHEIVLATTDRLYVLNLESKTLKDVYQSNHPIYGLAKNVKNRLVLCQELEEELEYSFCILDENNFEFVSRIDPKECDNLHNSEQLAHFRLGRWGDTVMVYKDDIVRALTIFCTRTDKAHSMLSEVGDIKDGHFLYDGRLLFVRKRPNDILEISVDQYPIDHNREPSPIPEIDFRDFLTF